MANFCCISKLTNLKTCCYGKIINSVTGTTLETVTPQSRLDSIPSLSIVPTTAYTVCFIPYLKNLAFDLYNDPVSKSISTFKFKFIAVNKFNFLFLHFIFHSWFLWFLRSKLLLKPDLCCYESEQKKHSTHA